MRQLRKCGILNTGLRKVPSAAATDLYDVLYSFTLKQKFSTRVEQGVTVG